MLLWYLALRGSGGAIREDQWVGKYWYHWLFWRWQFGGQGTFSYDSSLSHPVDKALHKAHCCWNVSPRNKVYSAHIYIYIYQSASVFFCSYYTCFQLFNNLPHYQFLGKINILLPISCRLIVAKHGWKKDDVRLWHYLLTYI